MQTDTPHDSTESLDRLVLLLAAQPRPGWEGIFEEVSRREVERLAPHPEEGKEEGASTTKTRPPKTLPHQGAK